jgi:hypothetical protein
VSHLKIKIPGKNLGRQRCTEGFNFVAKRLRKAGRVLIRGSHRPLHGVENVKSSVANDETGFKVLSLKHLLECIKVNRQPIEKREMKFKE